jgi:predicted transcriptional regulator
MDSSRDDASLLRLEVDQSMKQRRHTEAALLDFVIAQNVKRFREENRFLQLDIAKFLKVTQSHYSRMEAGQVAWTAYQLMRLCRKFVVTPSELVRVARR